MDKLASANSHFALDLFQKFSEANPTSNIFFSPLSISTALAMVYLGARGNTASQLAKTFHFDAVEDLHSKFQALSSQVNRSDAPYILKLANRLYGEKTYTFLQDFLTSTQKLYGAGLSTVDFLNASDSARKQINHWVEEQTEGKIPDLLTEGSINELTKLVLVNAIYFKGSWAERFQEEDTEDATFRLSKKEKKTVKMMFMKKKFPLGYIRECKSRVLELPYKGEELSMIILLPDDIEDNSTGLEQLLKQLTLPKLREWTDRTTMYSNSDVYVHLPRFKLEESYDLKSHLSALGLRDVFDSGKANLSGMSGAQDLFVSKIVHKSFIEVNEEGTEAAAATAVAFQIFTMDKLVSANAQFALDLFQKFNEADPTSNIFFSPMSISIALAMIYLGARGNTASQLAKIFHFDAVEDLHSRFQELRAEINRTDTPYILKLANRLYGEKTYTFLKDFLTSTEQLYGAELSTVDFLNASESVRKQINQWIEEQTEGKIPDLLPEGLVNELTKLVVVNAIYFKGSWAEKFQEEDTTDATFRLSKKKKKTVKMMIMKKYLPHKYIRECKCHLLELPYKGKELSMIILLPDDIDNNSTGLEQVLKKLTLAKLQKWTHPMKMNSITEIYVHLPQFKLEESYDLNSHLSALGLLDIFDSGKANLSGMSGTQDLFVSKIVHKSFIEVNEEGTEAGAAFADDVIMCCMPMDKDVHFIIDHPFLFFIRHNPTNTILFFGRVASP